MHLALGILPDDRGIFEVELLLFLGYFIAFQRWSAAISRETPPPRNRRPDACCSAVLTGCSVLLTCCSELLVSAALSRSLIFS